MSIIRAYYQLHFSAPILIIGAVFADDPVILANQVRERVTAVLYPHIQITNTG